MRTIPDPYSSYSHREIFSLIKEGKLALHEFGDWHVNRLVEATMKGMEREQEWALKERNSGVWAVPV